MRNETQVFLWDWWSTHHSASDLESRLCERQCLMIRKGCVEMHPICYIWMWHSVICHWRISFIHFCLTPKQSKQIREMETERKMYLYCILMIGQHPKLYVTFITIKTRVYWEDGMEGGNTTSDCCNELPAFAFTQCIHYFWKIIKYPRVVWIFNKLPQMRMRGKEDKGEAMSFDHFCSLRCLICVFCLWWIHLPHILCFACIYCILK